MINKFQIPNSKFQIDKLKLIFLAVFVLFGFLALQVPINVLAGARVKFTLFDLFAPVSGAFLGTFVGVLAVVAMQFSNLFVSGFEGIQTGSLLKLVATLRFLPIILGVIYFGLGNKKRDILILFVPIVSIIAFNLHPVGRTVWFYSLFWLIPLVVWPLRQRFLIARSLGSTFTAHAAGGAVWIWAFNLPAVVWQGLIPVVIMERAIFALGISANYILLNNIGAYLKSKNFLPQSIIFEKRYILKRLATKE